MRGQNGFRHKRMLAAGVRNVPGLQQAHWRDLTGFAATVTACWTSVIVQEDQPSELGLMTWT